MDEYTPGMKDIFEAYDTYKNMFLGKIDYPSSITGKIILVIQLLQEWIENENKKT